MNENPPEVPLGTSRRAKWAVAFAIGALIVVGGVFFWGQVNDAREAGRKSQCAGRLSVIGLALLNYEAKYGCFPPAYIADKEGRPMHSWRVLILPFMECQDLYDRLRLDEPWNSPHNLAVAQEIAHRTDPDYTLYHCPSDRDSSKWDTSYVMVVGPRMISDGATSTGLRDMTDGTSSTVLIVEMSDSGIHWMEPRDLKFDEMSFKINDPNAIGIRSKHPGGANVAFADNSIHWLEDSIPPEFLKALLTRNGREPVDLSNPRAPP